MKNKLLILTSFIVVFVISGVLIRNQSEPITPQEVENLSRGIEKVFQQHAAKAQTQQPPQSTQNATSESIMAIIYRKPETTWFIKARGASNLVNQQAPEFSQLFLEKLNFDDNQQPDFSHVPKTYVSQSTENMRIATFNLNGLEVSVTQLGAGQDVKANIARWRRQLSMPETAPQFVKYQNNDNTVLVRLDQNQTPSSAENAPKPPAKEALDDFLQLSLSDVWERLDSSSGMASGTLILTDADIKYEVAVLRLPSTVELNTILGIWKQRMGLAPDQPLTTSDVVSGHQQTWRLTPMQNDKMNILVAMHRGETRYTFMRLSHSATIPESARNEFLKLLKTSKVIK